MKKKQESKEPHIFRLIGQWVYEHLLMFATVLFASSFAVRFLFSIQSGPLVASIFPDELRYFHIAGSLAEHGQILVRNTPVTFQKILYPLFISPAFLLTSDQFLQTTIIRAINCLLMSSVVFPVALLAREMTSNKTVIIISSLVTLTLPDMAYSATIMSEVLYMPLTAWVFYFWYLAITEPKRNRRLFYTGVFGLIVYLAYLNKEIAAGFLIAAVLVLVTDSIRDKQKRLRNIYSMLLFLFVFFTAFFIMKLTLFQGMDNSYGASSGFDQITLSEFSGVYDWFYMVYGAGLFLVAIIMSFYVLPVLFSLYGYNEMNNDNRKVFLFSVFSLVVMIVAYAYTVLAREELGNYVPRLSMRYFAPICIPFLIQCFDFLLQDRRTEGRFICPSPYVIIAIFCTLLVVLMPSGPESDVLIDHFSLKSTLPLNGLHFSLDSDELFRGNGEMRFNVLWMLFKCFLLLLTVFGISYIRKGKRKPVLIVLLIFVFGVNVYDNTLSYLGIRYDRLFCFSENGLNRYEMPDYTNFTVSDFSAKRSKSSYDFAGSVVDLNTYVRTLDGTVLVCVDSCVGSYIDTYLDPTVFHSNYDELFDLADSANGYVDVGAQPISDAYYLNFSDSWKRDIIRFDYIIVLSYDNPFRNTELVHIQEPFAVLQNLNPHRLYLDLKDYYRDPGVE